jgi:hypothetical protein
MLLLSGLLTLTASHARQAQAANSGKNAQQTAQQPRPQSARRSTSAQQVSPNLAAHEPPDQPLPYSHKQHIAQGLKCQTCHVNPEPGNQMTFPAMATCMACHSSIATERPAIQKLASFASSGTPVPWQRVYALTPGVTWTHRKHLAAGVQCETCHGPVPQMDKMSQVTSVTSMGACISCHVQNHAKTACETCHQWPTPELLGVRQAAP